MILNTDALWHAPEGRLRLKVHSGVAWLTRPGDPPDRILESGDIFDLKGRGWLVQTLGGTPCVITTSMSSPTAGSPAIPSRSSSRKAG